MIVRKELKSVHDASTGRGRDVNVLTLVVMHCGTQRVSMLPVRSPSAYLSWFFVCNYFASWRIKCCFVVIHETMEVHRGRELWMQSPGSKKIQRDFHLWKESVPQVQWEGGVNRGDPGHKVFLERPDGAFRGVAAMKVRRHQLVSDIIDGEEVLQSGGCLVVESLELWLEPLDCELLLNAVICVDPFRGGPRFHGDESNLVEIKDIADHHIRVSFAGAYQELSCQVGVKLALIDYDCVHEVGLCAQVCVRCWFLLNGRLRG
jgi:hypothetical protein